jgi:hypothetical protein
LLSALLLLVLLLFVPVLLGVHKWLHDSVDKKSGLSRNGLDASTMPRKMPTDSRSAT